MVKLNIDIKDPISTILLGIIITSALMILIDNLESYLWVYEYVIPVEIVISGLIGGFVATYFAKDKKIRYGIYEGILAILIYITYTYLAYPSEFEFGFFNYFAFLALFLIFLLLLPAIIGGYLGKTIYTRLKNTVRTTG